MFRRSLGTIATLLGLASATFAQTPDARSRPEVREFGDWVVVCDNGNRCSATDTNAAPWIQINMSAGPDERPEILLGLSLPAETDFRLDSDTVALGSGPVAFAVIDREPPLYPGAQPRAILRVERAAEVLAALVAARPVTVHRRGDDPSEDTLEVGEIKQALAWIDERQGRTGTVTSLAAPGSLPASRVPPAPRLPPAPVAAPAVSQEGYSQVERASPLSLYGVISANYCPISSNEGSSTPADSARLDARTELWSVFCGQVAERRYYLTGPGARNPRLVSFQTFVPHMEGEPATMVPYATYIAADQSIVPGREGTRLADITYDEELYEAELAARSTGGYDGEYGPNFEKAAFLGNSEMLQENYRYVWTGRAFELEYQAYKVLVPMPYWPWLWRTAPRD